MEANYGIQNVWRLREWTASQGDPDQRYTRECVCVCVCVWVAIVVSECSHPFTL